MNLQNQEYLALPAKDLLHLMGEGNATPGSGSGAALVCIIACQLLKSVITLTRQPHHVALYQDNLARLSVQAESIDLICQNMNNFFQRDAEEFQHVIDLRNLIKETSDKKEQKKLQASLQRKLKEATVIPLEIAEQSLNVAKHGFQVYQLGFKSARGDTVVAISAALAAVSGAVSVTLLNLTSFRGSKWAIDTRLKVQQLTSASQDAQVQLYEIIASINKKVKATEDSHTASTILINSAVSVVGELGV